MSEWSQNETDRAVETWATLVGMYGNRWTREFGDSVPDPWRSAIKRLTDAELQRGFRRLAFVGTERDDKKAGGYLPNLPQFVRACRDIAEDDGPARPSGPTLPGPTYDMFHCFAARLLFRFVRQCQINDQQLQKMIQRKNEIISAARVDPDMTKGDPEEAGKALGEILTAAFRKVLETA